jgi:hypothetical protein
MSESTRAFIAQTAKRRDEAQIGMTCKEVIRMMMHLTRGTSNQCENHYDYLIRTGKMPELMNHGRVQRAQQTTTKRSCIRIEQQFRWHMTIKTIWEDHRRFNRNTTMGSGGNKKLPPRRFSTVGIVREFRRSPTQPPHKHHHHGGAVCPSYGVGSMDPPDRTRRPYSKGVVRGRIRWV